MLGGIFKFNCREFEGFADCALHMQGRTELVEVADLRSRLLESLVLRRLAGRIMFICEGQAPSFMSFGCFASYNLKCSK